MWAVIKICMFTYLYFVCVCVDWVHRCWNPHHKHILYRSPQRWNLRSGSWPCPIQPWTQRYSETSDSTEEPLPDRLVRLCSTLSSRDRPIVPDRTFTASTFSTFPVSRVTGQDVFLCGFAGALAGALTCGSTILNRNLHLDAIALAKKTKCMNAKLKGE